MKNVAPSFEYFPPRKEKKEREERCVSIINSVLIQSPEAVHRRVVDLSDYRGLINKQGHADENVEGVMARIDKNELWSCSNRRTRRLMYRRKPYITAMKSISLRLLKVGRPAKLLLHR